MNALLGTSQGYGYVFSDSVMDGAEETNRVDAAALLFLILSHACSKRQCSTEIRPFLELHEIIETKKSNNENISSR